MLSDELANRCDHCGIPHLYSWECRYDLHGEEDCFKTSCAVCDAEIASGAPRKSDRFGNLYCTAGCAMVGQDRLLDISMNNGDGVKAVAE